MPDVCVLSGPSVVSVALSVPLVVVLKVCVTAPFRFTAPENISVTLTGGVGVVGVVVVVVAAGAQRQGEHDRDREPGDHVDDSSCSWCDARQMKSQTVPLRRWCRRRSGT